LEEIEMSDENISYADTLKEFAGVLQQFNVLGEKYGLVIAEMPILTVEGGHGYAKITLAFNQAVLHEYTGRKDGHA
jgi:hypothetical protein